jgi:hypothetical protein
VGPVCGDVFQVLNTTARFPEWANHDRGHSHRHTFDNLTLFQTGAGKTAQENMERERHHAAEKK